MCSQKEISIKLRKTINGKCIINTDEVITIKIRRNFFFEDFRKHFNKKWNNKKKNCRYEILFLGESGVDTGGVSREFYSGMFALITLLIIKLVIIILNFS